MQASKNSARNLSTRTHEFSLLCSRCQTRLPAMRLAHSFALVLLVVAQLHAVAADQCGAYASSCGACGAAPAALNCGWCANSAQCLIGNTTGPVNGAQCGVGGWGVGAAACTQQAVCNVADGAGCSACREQGENCGYCSTTNRCETGSMIGSADNDCTAAAWQWPIIRCPAPADPCPTYTTCGDCESAEGNARCGWCEASSTCSRANTAGTGPKNGTCSGVYTFQSCSSDYLCTTADSCASCQGDTGAASCVWCADSGGSCMPGLTRPIPSDYCFAWTTGNENCPAPAPPTPPTPTPPPTFPAEGSFPLAGTLAIVFLCVIVLAVAVRLTLYLPGCFRSAAAEAAGASSFWSPAQGSRVLDGMVARDYSRGCKGATPFVLGLIALGFKIPALIVDQWDALYFEENGVTVLKLFWGTLNQRAWQMGLEGTTVTSYASACDMVSDWNQDDQLSHALALCRTQRAAGILTLVFGIGSSLAGALMLLVAVALMVRPAWFAAGGVSHLWRLSSLSHLCSLACALSWSLSAHFVIHHTSTGLSDTAPGLGLSWFLFASAWVVDALAVLYCLRAMQNTPRGSGIDEQMAAGMGMGINIGGGGGGEGYAVLSSSSAQPLSYPPRQQLQPVLRAPQPVRPSVAYDYDQFGTSSGGGGGYVPPSNKAYVQQRGDNRGF